MKEGIHFERYIYWGLWKDIRMRTHFHGPNGLHENAEIVVSCMAPRPTRKRKGYASSRQV